MTKNRNILLALFITVSLIGAIVGCIVSNSKKTKLDIAKIAYCSEFREHLKYPSIIAIRYLQDSLEYERIIVNDSAVTDLPFIALDEGQKVKILDGSMQKFKKIALYDENILTHQPQYSEYWIWHEFLNSQPPK